jgi:hypothetical protein
MLFFFIPEPRTNTHHLPPQPHPRSKPETDRVFFPSGAHHTTTPSLSSLARNARRKGFFASIPAPTPSSQGPLVLQVRVVLMIRPLHLPYSHLSSCYFMLHLMYVYVSLMQLNDSLCINLIYTVNNGVSSNCPGSHLFPIPLEGLLIYCLNTSVITAVRVAKNCVLPGRRHSSPIGTNNYCIFDQFLLARFTACQSNSMVDLGSNIFCHFRSSSIEALY